jgi:outer membrane immunogenic protein
MTSLSKFLVTAGLGLSALVALTRFSDAADLVPPPMRPAFADWTGLYVGGFGGVGCLEASYIPPYVSVDPNMAGCAGLIGLYGGLNYQIGSLLLGAEGDYGRAIDGHLAFADGEEQTNYSLDALATARGRIGWLPTESVLVYITGGAGWLDTTFDGLVGPDARSKSASETLFGWVVGGGIEAALTPNIHLKAEYLYGAFEDGEYDLTISECSPKCVVDMDVDDLHTFRVGLSYNFTGLGW